MAVLLITLFNIFYCFRKAFLFLDLFHNANCDLAYGLPTSVASMNYNSVILVGVIFLTGLWWVVYGIKNYPGPRLTHLYIHDESVEQHASVEFKETGTALLGPTLTE
jgi:hypothetical protein